MDRIKLLTLFVAMAYTIYNISQFGWNMGNSAVAGFLCVAIFIDFYTISKKKRDKSKK